ncbi:tryptophan-rich sensory protein [Dyadobacter subterraneus]|uniref:Tryptophan-rich sensory protein n=1 Tax=Dyadobacter subterraneus TaxID=2773304 RepID=A0ABR9WCS9_9BACT|nr:tryptophan-rich sensory protein [Dyadobacter subterraneus]MBE9463203.1 tryptophan-rich sensory protein [Dyadobacter subterraneus]
MKDIKTGRYITAAIVIGGILGTYFFSRPRKKVIDTPFDKKRQDKVDRNLVTPANETFGIVWSTIYIGTLALAIHQALPSQIINPRYQKAQPWLRISYLLTGLFGYFFSKSDKTSRIGAAVTTISMLPAAIALHRALEIGQTEVNGAENIIRKSISLYTGWLTAAAAVSATTLVQEAGYMIKPDDAKHWTLGLLPVTTGLGVVISNRLNDPYYLVTIIAALTGIAVKQKDTNKEISILASTLATYLLGIVGNKLKEQLITDNVEVALS